jgi:hypothetical protein
MQPIILYTQNNYDLLLIIQLAERLGIAYTQKESNENIPKGLKNKQLPIHLQGLVKPLSKVLEEIKTEQDYKGVNRKRWDSLIEELDIQESMEELIAQL